MKPYYIDDKPTYEDIRNTLNQCFKLDAVFPDQIFQPVYESYRFAEFDLALSQRIWPAIQELAKLSGDDSLILAVINPDPQDYYHSHFGYYNWAKLPLTISADEYASFISEHPPSSPADSVLVNSQQIIWVPSSRRWAIWGDRGDEVCVLGYRGFQPGNWWYGIEIALEMIADTYPNDLLPHGFEERFRANYQGVHQADR